MMRHRSKRSSKTPYFRPSVNNIENETKPLPTSSSMSSDPSSAAPLDIRTGTTSCRRPASPVTLRIYPLTVFEKIFTNQMKNDIQEVADLSYNRKWGELIAKLEIYPDLVNRCRLPKRKSSPPPTLYTPLHQAARGKAPLSVFEKLLAMGASKTLKTADGETAYDIGKRNGLNPKILKMIEVPKEIRNRESEIGKMGKGLHKIVLELDDRQIKKNGQELPQLSYLYEFGRFVCDIPGMYGGFSVDTHEEGILTESWCRVFGGSGKRHVVDREGKSRLIADGLP